VDSGEDGSRLLAAHHGNARIGPGEEETRGVGAARHAVIARTEASANYHGDLGHSGGGNSGNELRAVLGDTLRLILPADHEAGTVPQEKQRNAALAGELGEDQLDSLLGAYRTLTTILLRQQMDDFEAGIEPGSYVHPEVLTTRERQLLVQGFRAIEDLRGRVHAELTGDVF